MKQSVRLGRGKRPQRRLRWPAPVAEVMIPDPELSPGWHSVAEFAEEAARSRQDVFPVVGFDGELTGVVLASQFDDIPASDQARLRADKVALGVRPAYQAAPGDPAAPGQPRPAQW